MKINQTEFELKNGKTVLVRSVTSSDARKMLDHLFISHSESYKNLNQGPDKWKNFPVEKEEEILGDFENSPTKFMLVAIADGKIIAGLGFVGAYGEFQSKSGTIGMSIQNQYSGQGLGRAMLRLAISTARENGFHRMDLSVRTYNAPAIGLYEKMGFDRIGLLKEIAFIDGEYVDEFAYQKIL